MISTIVYRRWVNKLNVKQFKKRFIRGLVEPDLFKLPLKDEIKIDCSIFFVISQSYDLIKKEWLPLSSDKWIKDISQINLRYTFAPCEYVIKDSFGNIVQLNKASTSNCHLYNIKSGKYYLKILKSYYAEVNNEWIEFTLDKDDNNKVRYIELTPQNLFYKTKVSLLQDKENMSFTDNIYSDSVYQGTESTIDSHAYGVKKIEYFDKNNQLIYSTNTQNSGFHNPVVIGEKHNTGAIVDTVAAFVAMPEQDVIKMPVSYKLYCKGHDTYYHNQLSADVSFIKYAPNKRVKGYLNDEVMPTTLQWHGLTPSTQNRYGCTTVTPYSTSSTYYNCSSLEVTKCIGCIGSKSIDYIEEGTEPLDIMYSPLGYSDLNITYSTYNFYNLIKNYDNFLITYKESGTIDDGIHYFDGLWIVRLITKRIDIKDDIGREAIEIDYISYWSKEKAISYAETKVKDIDSKQSEWYKYVGEYELIYIKSEFKFPFELELLDIFKHKSTLNSYYPTYYNNGEIVSSISATQITDVNDPNYNIYLTYEGIQLLSYLQISDDYNQY